MRFALAIHGSRGDVEPFAAVALELLNRGHEVRMAVPPNMLGFVESAGLAAVAYGPSSEAVNEEDFVRNFWGISTPVKVVRASKYYLGEVWAEMGDTLTSLAAGTDLLMTGMVQQGLAINVAEYHRIPLAELHCFPVRVNGQILPSSAVAADPRRHLGAVVGALAHHEEEPRTVNVDDWDCPARPGPRRGASWNADRSRYRLTTSFSSPAWQPSGRNGMVNDLSSAL